MHSVMRVYAATMLRRKLSSSPFIASERRLSQTQSANSGGGILRSHAMKYSRISSNFTASPYGGSVMKTSAASTDSAAEWLLIFSDRVVRSGKDFRFDSTR